MRYTLLLHYPERTADELEPEVLNAGIQAFQAYAKALDDAGALVSGDHQPQDQQGGGDGGAADHGR